MDDWDDCQENEYHCPQCGGANTFGPDENGDVVCLDCGYVFDQDEG